MSEDRRARLSAGPDRETVVAEQDGRILGSYVLRADQLAAGAPCRQSPAI